MGARRGLLYLALLPALAYPLVPAARYLAPATRPATYLALLPALAYPLVPAARRRPPGHVLAAARLPAPPFKAPRVNAGEALPQANLGTASRTEWAGILDAVAAAHSSLALPPVARVEAVRDEKATCEARAARATARITDVAASSRLRATLVELGSREGRVARALEGLEFGRTVLVDRAHPTSEEAGAVAGERITCSLEDLELAGLAEPGGATVVAKHVCGAAMDYAIRCVARAPCEVLILAPCCYFLCEYGAYPNRGFLADCGFGDARAFALLTKLTQLGPEFFWRAGDEGAGQKAMDLLDAGRVEFLLESGMDAAAMPYAGPALAASGCLESSMIVAWRSPPGL